MNPSPRRGGSRTARLPTPVERPLHNLWWRGVGPLVLSPSKYERGGVSLSAGG